MYGCHPLEPIILSFLSSPCETWQCTSTAVGRSWGGPCTNFCSFWYSEWLRYNAGLWALWMQSVVSHVVRILYKLERPVLWAQARGREGSERGRDVFSNKIISIYTLKLGSSWSICRVCGFSFPPALRGGAGACRARNRGPVFFMHSFFSGLFRAFKE